MLLRKHFRRDSKIRYLRHKTLKTSVKNHYFFVKIFTKFDLPSRKSVCELIDDPLVIHTREHSVWKRLVLAVEQIIENTQS